MTRGFKGELPSVASVTKKRLSLCTITQKKENVLLCLAGTLASNSVNSNYLVIASSTDTQGFTSPRGSPPPAEL